MDGHINKYDGEPLEPQMVIDHVNRILKGGELSLDVSEEEARDFAYHYLRTHNGEKMRPTQVAQEAANGHGEPVWNVQLSDRATGEKAGQMKVGVKTGATYSFEKV